MLLLTLNLPPISSRPLSVLLTFEEVISPDSPFICFSWSYKALLYFFPAESLPGTRATAPCLLRADAIGAAAPLCPSLHHIVSIPGIRDSPAHRRFKIQRGFTLWQSSVLFLILVPYLIPVILFATSTATEQWADVFLVLTLVITSRLFLWGWWSSQKLSFYVHRYFSPYLWRNLKFSRSQKMYSIY